MSTNMAILQKTFGDRVREARIAKGLTQVELAERITMHQSDLCDLEKGKHAATLATVEKVAAALGISPSDLIS